VAESPFTGQDHEEFTMVAESNKDGKKKKKAAEAERVQNQVLDAIKKSQDATLKIVSAWSENVAKVTTHLPEMPKIPLVDTLPKPSELSTQFFEFAQELMTSQQEFVQKLLEALPGHDQSGD
jgi:3-methyladenine DNA glycosylase AlkC